MNRPFLSSLTRPGAHLGLSVLGLFGLSATACHYDIDKIFAGKTLEAPELLTDLWTGGQFSTVDADCAACGAAKCVEANADCRDDPDCVAFTRCIASSTDPATQAQCRSEFIPYLTEEIFARDIGGPYQQCLFQDECLEQCGSRTNWQCVGNFSWPTTAEEVIPFRFRFVEAFKQTELADVEIKVCPAYDIHCEQPTATGRTDAHGEVLLELPTALRQFQGYLELKQATLYPTLLKLGWPISREGVTNITLIDSMSVALNVAFAGVDPDPERGLLQVRFYSCTGMAAPGVSFTTSPTDESSLYWYAGAEGTPNFKATQTAAIGAGGVINAIEGPHTIVATNVADGMKVAEAAAPVRKGFMTIALLSPLAGH
jgi:hypothetical protein